MGGVGGELSEEDSLIVRSLAATYPNGFSLGEHRHRFGQLVYGVSGVMHVAAGQALWFVPPTRAIWLPPQRTHRIAMCGEVAMRTLYLAPELARHLPIRARSLEVAPLLRELILQILQLSMLDRERAEHGHLAAVLVDLVAAAPETDLRLPLPRDARALSAAEHLQAHPESAEELEQLARGVGASLRTLQRLFSAETGLSLDAWRHKARMIHAVTLLCGGESVTCAGLACGYDSTSAFIAAFRKQFGVTPGRYRRARA